VTIKRSIFIAIVLTLLVVALSPISVSAATTKYEYYQTGNDAYLPQYGYVWEAQTFTVDPVSHSVASVKLLLFRESTPGTITVSIQAIDGDGYPDGVDLTSATIDGDAITTSTSGAWYSFNFAPAVSVDYGEVYAIVVRAVSGTSDSICADWCEDESSPAYADGSRFYSTNGGATWTEDTDKDFMFQVYGEPLIDVYGAQVFRDFLEDDDMLFVLSYLNVYTPYYDSSNVSQYFDIRLTSSDGATVLASTGCRQWGYMPGSIYLSADQAAGLTPGSLYRLYIYGVLAEEPYDYYQLITADWRGSDLSYLDSWVITTANLMTDYYGVTLTQAVSGLGEILNEEGGVLFDRGIPGLSDVRPDMFALTTDTPVNPGVEANNALEDSRDWETNLGTDAVDLVTDIGGWWGIDGKDIAAWGIVIIYFAIAMGLSFGTQGNTAAGLAGAAMAAPVIVGGVWLGVISPAYILVTSAIGAFLLLYSFYASRT
jgi:hypothetical protein